MIVVALPQDAATRNASHGNELRLRTAATGPCCADHPPSRPWLEHQQQRSAQLRRRRNGLLAPDSAGRHGCADRRPGPSANDGSDDRCCWRHCRPSIRLPARNRPWTLVSNQCVPRAARVRAGLPRHSRPPALRPSRGDIPLHDPPRSLSRCPRDRYTKGDETRPGHLSEFQCRATYPWGAVVHRPDVATIPISPIQRQRRYRKRRSSWRRSPKRISIPRVCANAPAQAGAKRHGSSCLHRWTFHESSSIGGRPLFPRTLHRSHGAPARKAALPRER